MLILETLDFSVFLILVIFLLLLTKKLYKFSAFIYMLFVICLLYIPIGIHTYHKYEFPDWLYTVYFNLVLLSIIFLSLGLTFIKYEEKPFVITDVKYGHQLALTGIGLVYLALLVLQPLTATSQVILGVYFLTQDYAFILFWGSLGIFLKSNHPKKYKLFFMYLALFVSPNILQAAMGVEFSRFNIVVLVFYLFVVFNEMFENKKTISSITFAVIFTLGVQVNIFSGGDLDIMMYGLNIIKKVYLGQVDLMPGLIPYSTGFNLLPDPLHIKPKLFTINAHYFLDIMGWSFKRVLEYPFGLGVTGIADSYWNLGVFGTMFYFFMAGLYIGWLKSMAYIDKSGFAYGLYLNQIILFFMLYRLDFSFFFDHLLFIIPGTLYLIKIKKV